MKTAKGFGKRFLTLAAAAVIALSAYGTASAGGEHGHGQGAHWGYEGEHGPAHWGDMSDKFKACKEGHKQSPIDIVDAGKADLEDIEFHYGASKIDIINNGHTVQVNYDKGSYIKVNGKRYDLLQFHFHTPSEHTVGGAHYKGEMHLVHKSSDGKLAVVGVLIVEGQENPAYSTVWAGLPKKAGKAHTIKGTVDAARLLPGDRDFYTYSGSLTTPPCSEGVTWLVLTEPVKMSEDQIEDINKILHSNNRPTQPLHGRTVVKD
ncbi:MAG: carbonic anhydrase [Thermodesulfobacteriota bacterium]